MPLIFYDLPLCEESWELGTEDKVLNFKSAMMCTNNIVVDVVVMNLRIMDVVVFRGTQREYSSKPLKHSIVEPRAMMGHYGSWQEP